MPPESFRPEFPRPIRAATLPAEGRTESLRASAEECAALATRLGIPAVERLEAEIVLRPEPGGRVAATGTLRADVVQSCVVTLEPVPEHLEEPVSLLFQPDDLPEGELPDEDLEGPDEVPYGNGVLDLGEALAQQLALSLDPYPRAPGAELPDQASEAAENPFAALARRRLQ